MRAMRRTRSRRRWEEGTRGEDGNVILSILVIVVGSIAVIGLLSTVASGLGQAQTDQSRADAFQFANAGIDAALYRIDTKTLPTTPSGTYMPTLGTDGSVVAFTETLALEGVDYRLDVAQDPIGQTTVWRASSTGTDRTGQRRQAVADIVATRLFENSFFTINRFALTGAQFRSDPVAYDSATCPQALPSCALTLPVPGRLGTNDLFEGSTATLSSLIEQWGGFTMYGRATIEAARQQCFNNRCHTTTAGAPPVLGKVFNQPEALRIEVPPAPSGAKPCPNGGAIGAKGTTTSLPAGDYTCLDATLAGTVNVSGPGPVRLWVDRKLSAASGTVVNRGQRPMRFQVFQTEPPGGVPYDGEICGAEIWALLYTPGLKITCNGAHQPSIYGAVVANVHDGSGNHFKFHWDVSARDSVNNGRYNVRNWRECPVGTVDC